MINVYHACEADLLMSIIEVTENWARRDWAFCGDDEILYVLGLFEKVLEGIHNGELTSDRYIEEYVNIIIDRVISDIEVDRGIEMCSHDIEVMETVLVNLLRYIAQELRNDQLNQ